MKRRQGDRFFHIAGMGGSYRVPRLRIVDGAGGVRPGQRPIQPDA